MLGTNNTTDRQLRSLPQVLTDLWTDSNFDVNVVKILMFFATSILGPTLNCFSVISRFVNKPERDPLVDWNFTKVGPSSLRSI